MWADFHFLRPLWLLLLVPLVVFLAWFARRRFEWRRWQQVIDPALAPHVLLLTGARHRQRLTATLAIAGLLAITSLAGPVWQKMPQPVFRNLDALVIVLDLSESMNVADIKPSRLERARYKINDVLRKRGDGQTALVAYAADAYVISPLTDDVNTIIALLPALATDLMPQQGSRADRGLAKARDLLRQAGAASGSILLITDSVDPGRVDPVVRNLATSGIRTSVLGIGTDVGGPIPGRGGFVTKADGSIVIATLDANALEEVAEQGQGSYHPITADDSDIGQLLAGLNSRPETTEASDLQTDSWREEGPWLLLPLLPLAAFAFRRGVLAASLLLPVLLLPVQPARAFELSDLWSRPDQRASRLFEQGDAAGAAQLFADPSWKAAAAYRAGKYQESLAALEGRDDVESTYNRGNALAQLGRYDEAIAAYEDVLRRQPNHDDASHNLELLKKQQQQQQQQQAQQNAQDRGAQDPSPSQGSSDAPEQQGQQQASQGQQDQQGGQDQQGDGEQAEGSKPSPAQADAGEQNSSAEEAAQADDSGRAQPGNRSDARPAEGNATAGDEMATDAENPVTGEAQPGSDGGQADAVTARPADAPFDEDAQAAEQWLRTIPDDPGGLLRRKFYYQYQQQDARPQEEQPW